MSFKQTKINLNKIALETCLKSQHTLNNININKRFVASTFSHTLLLLLYF